MSKKKFFFMFELTRAPYPDIDKDKQTILTIKISI